MNQRELFLRHVAQTSDSPFSGVDVNIIKASGCTLTDASGKTYLDLISGISVSSIGHCHPRVVKAVQEQAQQYMHLIVYGEFNQAPQVKYATLLAKQLPESLSSVYFTTGGSEAIEGAMKLAKRVTGRSEIIGFKHAYHGSTQGALSLMGDEYFKTAYRPLLPTIKHIDYSSFDALEEITTATAAVFIEPIQGEAGVRKANPIWLSALSKKCKATGTLLVFDEIQTGFGRTGTLFAFQQTDVVPDILVMAKGMGGGMPVGAFVASQELMSTLTNNPVLGHINTFGGNAVCVAAAQACLEVLLEENLSAGAFEIETQIKEQLQHPLIKELRIHGALGAIDFGEETLNMRAIKACIEHGLITDWFLFCNTAMRISPPLTITKQELRSAIEAIHKALDSLH